MSHEHQTLVVDASVVVKWLLPEPLSEAARRLLVGPHGFVAPDVLFLEAGNAIWKRVRRQEITSKQGRELMADLIDVAVDTVTTRELAGESFELAVATGIAVYDASYLVLAIRFDTRFITADQRLAKTLAAHPALARFVQPLVDHVN